MSDIFNKSQLDLRSNPNLFINSLETLNQQDITDWDSVLIGEMGYDWWIKIDANTKRQPIEETGYTKNTVYAISYLDNSSTLVSAQITSPESGDWDNTDLDIPIDATEMKLELGHIGTQFVPDRAVDILLSQGGNGGGGGTPTYVVASENYTLEVGEGVLVDIDNSPLTMTLPDVASVGDWVSVGDYNGTATIVNPIVITSTSKIHGNDEDLYITNANTVLTLSYVNSAVGWKIVDGIGEGANANAPYEEVSIYYSTGNPSIPATITLPDGYVWDDFERIEMAMGYNSRNTVATVGILTKEVLQELPSSWTVELIGGNATANHTISVNASSTTTANTSVIGAGALKYVKGYTKYKPTIERGKFVEIWSGNASSGTITCAEGWDTYDAILLECDVVDANSSGEGLCSTTLSATRLVTRGAAIVFNSTGGGTSGSYVIIGVNGVTATTLEIHYEHNVYDAVLTGVYGIKY